MSFTSRTLSTALLLWSVAACDSSPSTAPSAGPPPAPSSAPKLFGTALEAAPVHALSEILDDPTRYEAAPVIVTGHVRRACQAKGCWMEMAESSVEGARACRVTFKDYGFFVPKTSAGASARLRGTTRTKILTPADVAHLESDGAKFARKEPDGSVREVSLVATGVELTGLI